MVVAEKYGIPIHLIGIGERADDLRPFDAHAFARGLVGLKGNELRLPLTPTLSP